MPKRMLESMKNELEDVVKAARDAECEALAQELTQFLTMPIELSGKSIGNHEFTFADLLRQAVMLLGAANMQIVDFMTQEKNRVFLERVNAAVHNLDDFRKFLQDRLLQSEESLADLQAATAQIKPLIADRASAARFVRQRMNENLRKGRQGRPSRFHPSKDVEPFLALSAQLLPLCHDLVDMQKRFPDKPLLDVITFVASNSPDGFRMLRQHQETIQQLSQIASFIRARSIKIKARRLADAIAGKELFDWKAGYSSDCGDQFRRLKARRIQG